MKIKRIKLRYLRNEEWFNFFTEFKTFVEEFFPQAQDIEELFATFLILYASADEVLEKIAKSEFSDLIVLSDERRDNSVHGLTATVNAAMYHYDDAKRAAAEKIGFLLGHYDNLAGRPYNEETAAIYNFVQELRGKYAGAVATLELNGWVDKLEKDNNDFEKAILDRNREGAGKPDIKLVDVRAKTNRCYLDIVERLEALMLVRGDEFYAPFVKTLNNNIDRYNNALARRGKSGNSE